VRYEYCASHSPTAPSSARRPAAARRRDMTVDSMTVSMLLREMNREFSFYEDLVTFIGLCYAGKLAFGLGKTLCTGFYSHFYTKLTAPVDLATKFGKWAGEFRRSYKKLRQ
jgi:hypothetical protein